MSKFLEAVQEHTPEKDLDATMKAKRDVQHIFMNAGYKADAKVFRDEISLTLKDGTKVVLEVKSVVAPTVEDNEDLESLTSTLATADAIQGHDKVGMLARDGKKQVAKAKNKLYNKMAKKLNTISRDI